ncbi:hypothetical protein CHS0354_019369 [Potamilus streckersoni]|uniref:Uncharacterized protein n=1 Tax=Potamilus streckersoni TaxID=2493646 RepID=A0AAE0SHN5_9BIVA|nr:hypothetical protein CHS0354_019369 [Potamilus streckersoni]
MQDMPNYIRVDEDVMGITKEYDEVNMFRVPKNTVLKLDQNQTENKYLICLMNETKVIMFHTNCSGKFTGLEDKAEDRLAGLLEKVKLPVKVDIHIIKQEDIANENETSAENLRTMLSGPVEILSVARTQLYIGCIWICDGTYQPFVLPIKSGMRCYPLARTQSKEALISRYFSSKINFETVERKVYNINVDPPSIMFLKKIVVVWRKVPRYSTTGSLDEKDIIPSRKKETDNDYKNVTPVMPHIRALCRSLSSGLNVNCTDSMSNQAPQLPPRRNRCRSCRPLTSYTPSCDYARNEVGTDCGKGMDEQPSKAIIQHDIMEKNKNSKLSNSLEMVQSKAQHGFKNEHNELRNPASDTVEKIQDRQSIHTDDIVTGDIMLTNRTHGPATKTKTPNGHCSDHVVLQSELNSENKTIFKVVLNPRPVGKVADHKTVGNTKVPNISLGLNTCSVDHQATNVLVFNTDPLEEEEDYLAPIPSVDMLTKQARKSFYSFSVLQIVHCFRSCKLDTLANICETEKLDGSFFQSETEENISQLLSEEPFNLNAFEILKVKKIMDGWRPKLDKFGGVSAFTQ